jgi:hypothetical protein
MQRIFYILVFVGLGMASGCRMCAHPYDYCGPTYVGQCGTVCCDPDARAGSVLSRPLDTAATPAMAVEESAGPIVETPLEPIPRGEEIVVPSNETSRLVPLPAPPARSARVSGPTYLR